MTGDNTGVACRFAVCCTVQVCSGNKEASQRKAQHLPEMTEWTQEFVAATLQGFQSQFHLKRRMTAGLLR